MSKKTVPIKIVGALCAALTLASATAVAEDGRWGHGRGDPRWSHGHDNRHDGGRSHARNDRHDRKSKVVVVWRGNRHWVTPPRRTVVYHTYRPLPVYRHHHDYRHHDARRDDRDNWALYAILALQLVNTLNESQQQSYAWAQQRAVAAPLGDSIQWQDNGAYGSVTAVRDGTDGGGRYCREFQHQITVGNRLQSGYGIACRQPDGDWEIVS